MMIRVLDSFTADKIAAGEVIERPVSAVKELVENSIDAGSDSIIVEIRNGGKSYMRVTDNGCGIPADEAETAFLRHATSKISSVSDLDSISSLGFRGEALASISAVSRLTMVSRTRESASGVKLVMHGGRVVSNERTGANPGTTVIAEDLFYNTPARRKFMKSDAREATAVIELVQQLAVCYAEIRFMLINNGQTVFSTAGDGDTMAAVRTLYPDIARRGLIPVTSDTVRGFVSDPGSTMSTRKGQLFFVNGRLVSSAVIEKGIEDGFHGRIFSGFPAAVLFIDADPHDIDVNIHPGKREIRFLRQEELRSSIAAAVSDAVMSEAGIPKAVTDAKAKEEAAPVDRDEAGPEASQTSIKDYLSSLQRTEADRPAVPVHAGSSAPKAEAVFENELIEAYEASDGVYEASDAADYAPADFEPRRPFEFTELALKGYVFDTYIIMQGRDELYIFDQHAAHERVFYERFMKEYNNTEHIPQPILTPFTINVSADVYLMDRGWLAELGRMGYEIEDFGERTFLVRGIPAYMSPEEAESFVRSYMEGASDPDPENRVVTDKLILRSCRSAVKANDRLSGKEIDDLMKKLSECENPYSCPHGRPTFIRISSGDIERSFRRK